MSAILILIIALALLACGYIFYGSFLAKKWGVDPNRETPAHTSYDGKEERRSILPPSYEKFSPEDLC